MKTKIIILFLLLAAGIGYYHYYVAPNLDLNTLNLQDLNGTPVSSSSLLGKPLVLNYWATWCGPCRKELPDFEAVQKELGGTVNIVAVSDETEGVLNNFKEKHPFNFTFLRTKEPFKGVNSRPTTFFYNAQGILVNTHTGPLNAQELMAEIKKLTN